MPQQPKTLHYLDMDDEEQEKLLRRVFNIAENEEVPQEIWERAYKAATIERSPEEKLEWATRAVDKFKNSGVADEKNPAIMLKEQYRAQLIERDRLAAEQEAIDSESNWIPSLRDIGNAADTFQSSVASLFWSGVKTKNAISKQMAEKLGGEWSYAITGMPWFPDDMVERELDYHNEAMATNSYEISRHHSPWYSIRGVTNWAASTAAALAEFGLAGAGSTIATGTPAPGIATVIAAHANREAVSVYEETGNLDQAIFAGTVHAAATATILKVAHKLSPSIQASSRKVLGLNFGSKEAEAVAASWRRGNSAPAMAWIKAGAGIEATAIGTRNMQYVLNTGFQEFFHEGEGIERFKFSVQNFMDTTKHGAEEGMLFVLLPTLTNTLESSLGRGNRVASKEAKIWSRGLNVLSQKIRTAELSELEILVQNLSNATTTKSGPLQKLTLEMMKDHVSELKGEAPSGKTEAILKEIGEVTSTSKKAKMYKEANEAIREIVGDYELGNLNGKNLHKSNESRRNEIERESIDRLERKKTREEETGTPKPRTEEEVARIKAAEVDSVKTLISSALESKEGFKKLEQREHELSNKPHGKLTNKEKEELQQVREAHLTAKEVLESRTGAALEPTSGRTYKVGDKTLPIEETAKIIGSTKKAKKKDQKAATDAVTKAHPELTGKKPKQLARALRDIAKKDVKEAKTRIGEVKPVNKEKAKAFIEAFDKLVEKETAKGYARGIIENLVKKAKEDVSKFAKTGDKAELAKNLHEAWRELIAGVEEALGELSPDAVKTIKGFVKIDDAGVPVKLNTSKQFDIAADKASKIIEKEGVGARDKRIGDLLSLRKESVNTRLETPFDNVITAIKKALNPKKWKEGGSYVDAIQNYYKLRAEDLGRTKETAEAQAREIIDLVKKAEAGKSTTALSPAEKLIFGDFIELMYNEHKAGRAIDWKRKRARAIMFDEALNREINKGSMSEAELTGFETTDIALRTETQATRMVKALTWGVKENGRLQEYVEFIFGGNNTTAYKVLVENPQQGLLEAYRLQHNLSVGLEKALDQVGLTPKEYFEMSGDAKNNNPNNKRSFKPALVVKTEGGITWEMSRQELLGFLLQAGDARTKMEWIENNVGIRMPNRPLPIRSKNQKRLVEEIIERSKGTKEAKAAKAILKFVNSKEVRDVIKEVGFRLYGIDPLVHLSPGEFFFPSKRFIEKAPGEKAEPEVAPDSVIRAFEADFGFSHLNGVAMDSKVVKARSKKAPHDLIVADGVKTVEGWIHSISMLAKWDEHVTLAQSLIGAGKLKRTANRLSSAKGVVKGRKERMQADLLGNLNEAFYKPQIRTELAHSTRKSDIERWFTKIRRNVVRAKLAGKVTVMSYQGTSSYAATVWMGPGGKRAMAQAAAEVGSGFRAFGSSRNRVIIERMIRNSPLAWKRIMTAGAESIATGAHEIRSSITVVGKKFRSYEKGGLRGKASRTIDRIMDGITWVDMQTVATVFRATEIHVAARWKSRGKDPVKEKELYDEVVRREFEENIIETQPNYIPLVQPAIVNRAKDSALVSFYTMFRGYTGKLVSIQRRSLMRSWRSLMNGDLNGAHHHLSYAFKMTMVGAALIPIIREEINFWVKNGFITAAEATGLIDDLERDLGAEHGETLLRAAKEVGFGLAGGLTGGGKAIKEGFITGLDVSDILERDYGTPTEISAYHSSVRDLIQAAEGIQRIDPDDPASLDSMYYMIDAMGAGGTVLGIPEEVSTQIKRFLRSLQDKRDRDIKKSKERLIGG